MPGFRSKAPQSACVICGQPQPPRYQLRANIPDLAEPCTTLCARCGPFWYQSEAYRTACRLVLASHPTRALGLFDAWADARQARLRADAMPRPEGI